MKDRKVKHYQSLMATHLLVLDILSTTLTFTLAIFVARDGGVLDYLNAAMLIFIGLNIFSHSIFLFTKEKIAMENYAANTSTGATNEGGSS